jgi:hypothetical protein
MAKNSEHAGNSSLRECARTRIAESAIAAVDECECGMLQLHLGALTLRLTPPALAELWETLGCAMRKGKESPAHEVSEALEERGPFLGGRRGEA